MRLGVNVDHIATLREARAINEPNPLEAVFIAKNAGAHQITIHLREDRRHIHDSDVRAIIAQSPLPVNVECALTESITEILCALTPHRITLVPEKRQEVTTEGGLDLKAHQDSIARTLSRYHAHGIHTALFIDPSVENVTLAKELGAHCVELHTGKYANLHLMRSSNLPKTHHSLSEFALPASELESLLDSELTLLANSAKTAREVGLECFAGHGLNYQNIAPIRAIDEISELNIGHSIIARAVFVGLERAIADMLTLCRRTPQNPHHRQT